LPDFRKLLIFIEGRKSMKRMPTIKTVMTPFPYSVDAGASVNEAQEFMRTHDIRHLPVTEDGGLVGIVSDRDIKLMLGPDFAYPDGQELKVHDAMVAEPYTVDLSERLDQVLAHMAEHHLGSVLVTRKEKLVGVFTVTDACGHFAEFLREQVRRSGGGEAA
jgi:acetoin utilization protein AcuB